MVLAAMLMMAACSLLPDAATEPYQQCTQCLLCAGNDDLQGSGNVGTVLKMGQHQLAGNVAEQPNAPISHALMP